ncbi:MAG: DUF721 domain-containing protein [Elusimicrobia bacterium]|nr:DUF721 domain-containing protein [Elusimicrobiota bacterium]
MKWKDTDSVIDRILRGKKPGAKDRVEKAWNGMEKNIRERAKIIMLKKGVLILEVGNNADLQDLSFKREMIKKILNRDSEQKITGIRFKLGG